MVNLLQQRKLRPKDGNNLGVSFYDLKTIPKMISLTSSSSSRKVHSDFESTFYSCPRKTTTSIPTVILSQGSPIEQGKNGNRDTPDLLALPKVS